MILLLRGHIRTGFDTPQLYVFLQLLHSITPLTIYIHTWDIKQNSLSWRHMEDIKTEITTDMITAYFRELASCIKVIRIDPDGSLPIHGSKEGKITRSRIPTIGWKNMWAGKYTILEQIYRENPPEELLVNTRFDLFTNSVNIGSTILLRFYGNALLTPPKTVSFLQETPFNGCDNFYIGTSHAMFKLAQHFHANLDTISSIHSRNEYPERLVMLESHHLEKELLLPA
jgi:hypothetical protein